MSGFENHPQWGAVNKIHQVLKAKGYRSLIAGGAVRDLLMERQAKDIDLATNATPDQVEALFEKTVMVGKAFGVARVVLDGHEIEVATFRKDGDYQDGRKPESVEYSSEEEDAKRRDFTINAMFYDIDKKEIIDFVGGQADVMSSILRTVGDADQRFSEDKLRILRAIRFQGQLGFYLEQKTAEAIKKHARDIRQVSQERIRDEWDKLMGGEHAVQAMQKAYDLHLWLPLFGEWRFQLDEYKKIYDEPPKDALKRWILWFLIHCQESKEVLATQAMNWKLPKKLIQSLVFCYQSLSLLRDVDHVESVDLAIFLSKPHGRLAVDVYRLLYQSRIPRQFDEKFKVAEDFFKNGQLPELLVNGDDLLQFGVKPGPDIAKKMQELHRLQLMKGITQKEDLMAELTSQQEKKKAK